jgi:hypothetical protein
MIPIAFLAPNQALAIAIFSYNGKVRVGLIGDFDSMSDLDDLAEYVKDATAELLAAARAESGSAEQVEPTPSA